ncbi:MAG: hypothetical protein A3H35_11250 [Betaproteobacteria bacterium RIFCSPLOWO2_02_FULL_62_17]|nr:MAG: hypothetical protein A3H35_11250 [Betaproteobacteria bacterium RIFCSPLOWO2_02_FULL_62_17]
MRIAAIAAELIEAEARAATLAPIAARTPGFDLAAAYRVQAEITRQRLASGWRMVGRKIGFTNRGIWPLYGVDAPMWAPVFDRTVIHTETGRARVSLAGTVQPRIEPEILLCLAAPLPAGLTEPAQVSPYVAWYAHSVEIVHSHYPGWKAQLADFCADNACHARLLVGPARKVAAGKHAQTIADFENCQVALMHSGRVMQEGRGGNALGHPLLALAYLADVLAAQTRMPALAAGEIVSTGTLTDALPVAPGETWSTRFSGLEVQDLDIEFLA